MPLFLRDLGDIWLYIGQDLTYSEGALAGSSQGKFAFKIQPTPTLGAKRLGMS